MVVCAWKEKDGGVCMEGEGWWCVHGRRRMVVCAWKEKDGGVCMEGEGWWCVHGRRRMVVCAWKEKDGGVCMEREGWWCVHGRGRMVVCAWKEKDGGVFMEGEGGGVCMEGEGWWCVIRIAVCAFYRWYLCSIDCYELAQGQLGSLVGSTSDKRRKIHEHIGNSLNELGTYYKQMASLVDHHTGSEWEGMGEGGVVRGERSQGEMEVGTEV